MFLGVSLQLSKQADQISNYLTNLSWREIGRRLANRCLSFVLITLAFLFILWLGKKLIDYSFRHSKRFRGLNVHRLATFHSLTNNIFRYTCLFFYLYAVLELLGIPVGTLVAGAGIFSIALGLGAQGFVSDVVNGIFILTEQQIDVGDTVEIGTIKGTVTALGLRTTQVTSSNGTLNFIPNRNISIVRNFSRNNMVATVDLNLPTGAPLEKITQLIQQENDQLVKQQPNLLEPPQIVGPVTINGQLVFRVLLTAKNGTQNKLASHVLANYLEVLRQNKVTL
ncbi:MAG: mechanosensitive ion channel family protein [[Lactobacillus] timonensis]|jgi:small conductance mechanosensitive channel|uniref:mechanosensitive ion channel family protein n=1 Tax=[Lactobacillus] timonensis TaxID=1970790 RepID=UPI002356FEB9|nr:mechanosensitive ion channel domain-containing protein [[Lactobacillus] timonensis]MCI1926534.1 mechanosensitive ion channel family protein [[Lactobacillus] timonensis]MCI1957934.1 mechanosensitive ion channel family protein [[Lactobacillus] timonensis]MCI1970932.1 mechanosensitive ion channel family protein [[Lactobacillus] timonensis]MCI2007069.1 mechanosensitive ion channel family protein [[Lactobacillus] timonensis]